MGSEPRPRFPRIGHSESARRGRVGGERRRRRARRAWAVQELEARTMLSTFTVTDTLDDGNTGSLRWAINQVNADTGTGADTIDFNIPGTGPFTITPSSPLPSITHPVLIDGYSQPGASANTAADSDNAVLMIDLSGYGGAYYGDGLDIDANDSTVQGLAINYFNNGLNLLYGSGDLVQGNFIGTDVTGSSAQFNYQGIMLSGATDNTIGGTTPAARNIVSGNYDQDIALFYYASGNLIEGNFVGLTASGTSTLYTYGIGVITNYSPDNTVGGTAAGAGNVIGGLSIDGIQFAGVGDNLAEGNVSAPTRPGRSPCPTARASTSTTARRTTRSAAPRPGPATSSRATAPASSCPTARTTTSSKGISSAPMPPARAPWGTPGRASRSPAAPRTTPSAGRGPARATSSPITAAPGSSWATIRATSPSATRSCRTPSTATPPWASTWATTASRRTPPAGRTAGPTTSRTSPC